MRDDKNSRLPHTLPATLLSRRVNVHLVGCGGTGSRMLTNLSQLHLSLIALGHPAGLMVTAYDPDRVSGANVGRQLFAPSDIGQPKATVLINRLNLYFGLDWGATCERYDGFPLRAASMGYSPTPDIVITCVDTIAARQTIERGLMQVVRDKGHALYWLDCGNSEQTGQVFLTEVPYPVPGPTKQTLTRPGALPSLRDALPELFDSALGLQEDNLPSCSLAEALERQNLVINGAVATMALNLLWNLFRDGGLTVHGYWINLATGHTLPVPVSTMAKQGRARK